MSEAEKILAGAKVAILEQHKPEPGGCTCGFCVYSAEHVLEMFLRDSGLLALIEAGQANRNALFLAVKTNWEGSTDADVLEHLGIKAWDAAWEAMRKAVRL